VFCFLSVTARRFVPQLKLLSLVLHRCEPG